MKQTTLSIHLLAICLFASISVSAQIDMQLSQESTEGRKAYSAYQAKQKAYYTGNYAIESLRAAQNGQLFGLLNKLMETCRLDQSGFSYKSLRYEYVDVDRDLNTSGRIIGYYDGTSLSGDWNPNSNYNREHTWPQSKGADSGIPMGYDMQSVRPANVKVNSERGNTAYGESSNYYNPDNVKINNSYYKTINNGTYRGDAARVILYDYVVYGELDGHKNRLYNGNAQLLSKLGKSGVFESLEILLKWHMQDPPSLTEMVRNDGAQAYQGNRNPFIDYPELAINMLLSKLSNTRTVSLSGRVEMAPAYTHTLPAGFVCYLNYSDGSHPDKVSVNGAKYNYEANIGRLTISNVTANMTISVDDDPTSALEYNNATAPKPRKILRDGQILILMPNGDTYNIAGIKVDD